MKMKKLTIAILLVLLGCLLCLPAAAAGDSFNPKLTVDRTAEASGRFTVTIAETNDALLAEKKPTLRLPCSFAEATVVVPGGSLQAGIVADGSVSFKVTKGGTYTIMRADLVEKTLTGIAVTTHPKLNYIEGEALDLSGMIVTCYYDDGRTAELNHTEVIASVPHGTVLEAAHNGMPICISYGGKIAYTDALIVQKAPQPEPKPEPQPDYWLMVLLKLYNQELDIGAVASEGGTITPAGITAVKYGRNVTFTITPDEGYTIADVLIDGKSVGAVSEYTFKKVRSEHTIAVVFSPVEDVPGEDEPTEENAE